MVPPQPASARLVSPTIRDGFVLVSVLLIVALATVLVVVASMMAQIERRAASNSAKIEQARGNALFALDVALNQLQREAGPDQRITARAEILDTNSTTLSTNAVNQPLWTGVWRTGTNHLDVGGSGAQRSISLGGTATPPSPSASDKVASARWLISGTNASPDPRSYVGTTNGVNADAVALARNQGTNAVNVLAPLVAMTSTVNATTSTNGAYAYWVSDEGVKAKVNVTDRTLGASSVPENQLHFFASQGAHAGKGVLGASNSTDLRAPTLATNVAKVTTLATLQRVSGIASGSLSGTNVALISPDATTYSYGVLADVRAGGLKKDLTAALEDNGQTAGRNYAKLQNANGTARVYQAPAATVGPVSAAAVAPAGTTRGLDGLRWLNLYQYYNLYKSVFPTTRVFSGVANVNGSAPAGVGNPTASLPFAVGPRGIGSIDPDLGAQSLQGSFGMLSPIFLGYRWDVSISSRSTGSNDPVTGNPLYALELHYYPQLILYNPYAVSIRSNANNFRFGRALAALSATYLETVVGTGGAARKYYTLLNQGATLQRMLIASGFDDMQVLEPGEIRVFGLSSSQTVSQVRDACEFRDTTAPFGLVSRNYAPSFCRSVDAPIITTLDTSNPVNPLLDAYAPMPGIPAGSPVTFRLTGRPSDVNPAATSSPGVNYTISGSGSADVSIPNALMWVTDGGSGGSVLSPITGRAGSIGRRQMQSGAPGSISTGSTGSVTRSPLSVAAVESLTETQLIGLFVRKKGISPTSSAQYSNSSFVVPYFCGNSAQFNLIYDAYGSRYWDELFIGGNNSWPSYPPSVSELQLDTTTAGYTTTSWGNTSAGVDAPGSRIVLVDVPIQPMVSLGQFMHLQPFYMFNTGAYTTMGFGSMFVGGSLASPEVPLDVTARDITTGSSPLLALDHSFLANQALFDRYFFSTVPPAGSAPSGTTWPAYWTSFNAANSGASLVDSSLPLLNGRMKPYAKDRVRPQMADLRDMDKAAANLMLEGAFNVNSTSVEAWQALLSSPAGNALTLWDATNRTTFNSSSLQNPICRFWSANSNNLTNTRWSGIRSLSDSEVQTLAQRIVEQVKVRGPFLSLADFLNRRLGSSSDLTRAGSLQAAIDRTTLNNGVKSGNVVNITTAVANAAGAPQPIPANFFDSSSSAGSAWDSAIGVPGYLMQQDLVQSLAPAIAARSDTFVIRVYGEVRNPLRPTAGAEGAAWGEAVVQRVPDLVDASQLAETDLSAMNATNTTLGRRFKVVSFRWLASNEI